MSAGGISDVGKTDENGDFDVARKGLRIYDQVLSMQAQVTSFEKCRVPVICAIHGYCIGAGIDMASACDIRLCARDVKFTIKEVDIGIAADIGTLQRFQKVVGNDSWARELAYTARFFGAEEAQQKGFVSGVYDTKEACSEGAMKLAKLIASKSPVAINITKKSIIYSRDHTVTEGLHHIAVAQGSFLQTNDTMAAVSATLSKSKPEFAKL